MQSRRKKTEENKARRFARLEGLESRDLLAGDAFEAIDFGIDMMDGGAVPHHECAEVAMFDFDEALPADFLDDSLPNDDFGFGFDSFFPMWGGFEVPELSEGELPEGLTINEDGELFGADGNPVEVVDFDIAESELPDGLTIGEDGELLDADGNLVEIFDVDFDGVLEDLPEDFEFLDIEGEHPEDFLDLGFVFECSFEEGVGDIVEGELPEGFTIGEDGELLDADGNPVEVFDIDFDSVWEGLPEDFEVFEFDGGLPEDFFDPDFMDDPDFMFDPFCPVGEFGHDIIELPEGELPVDALPDGFTIGENGEWLDADGNPVEFTDMDLDGEFMGELPVDEDGNVWFELLPDPGFEFGPDDWAVVEGELPDGYTIGENGELIDADGNPVDVFDVNLDGEFQGELPEEIDFDGELPVDFFDADFMFEPFCPVGEIGHEIVELPEGELPDGFTVGEDGELLDADGNPVEFIDVDLEGEYSSELPFDEDGNILVEFLPDSIFEFGPEDWGSVEIAEGELPDGITITDDGDLVDADGNPIEVIDVDFDGEFADGMDIFDFDGELPTDFFGPGFTFDPFCPVGEIGHEDVEELPDVELPADDVSSEQGEITPDDGQVLSNRVGAIRQAYETDLNRDGTTDFGDFLILSDLFGDAVDTAFADGDMDGDSLVGFQDFLIFAVDFVG